MTVGGLVEGRGNYLCINGAGHIGHFLRTFVDEQHHDIGLGMVGSDGVRDILHQYGFTGLGLGHNESTLTFTDRREEVDDTHAGVCSGLVATEYELFLGEERCQVLESYAVADFRRVTAVDGPDIAHSKIFLVFERRTYGAVYHVTRLQTVGFDLCRRYIDIVGRGEVVVVAGTDESIAIGQYLKHAVSRDDIVEFIFRGSCGLL